MKKISSAVGEVVDAPKLERKCNRCGDGQADVVMPVENMYPKLGGHWTNQRFIPDPLGRMLCWGCYGGKQ